MRMGRHGVARPIRDVILHKVLVLFLSEPVKPVGPLLDGLRNGCASGLATVCAKAMLQPFDTIKTLQQTNTGKLPQGMLQTATTLVNERGAVSLYRGLGVALMGSVPAMCAAASSNQP